MPGFYHHVDHSQACHGYEFDCHSVDGSTYQRKIVEWVPNHVLSIGLPGRSDWEHEFVIRGSDGNVELQYSRKFKQNVGGFLYGKLTSSSGPTDTVEAVIQQVKYKV